MPKSVCAARWKRCSTAFCKRKFLDAARLDVRGMFLGRTLFKRYTVCTAKMAEPIDGKAPNRLRYTVSVVKMYVFINN